MVPCYNVAQYLRECRDSVLNGGFEDWECILDVEESTDNTLEIAREYAASDGCFKIFTGPCSGGCSTPRNKGVAMAKGEYVIFLDSDDSIVAGSLRRIHDHIAANPGADLYPCAIVVNNELTRQSEPERDNYPAGLRREMTGPEATRESFLYRRDPCPMLQMTVCRREYLVANDLWCREGIRNEDSEFSPRALLPSA